MDTLSVKSNSAIFIIAFLLSMLKVRICSTGRKIFNLRVDFSLEGIGSSDLEANRKSLKLFSFVKLVKCIIYLKFFFFFFFFCKYCTVCRPVDKPVGGDFAYRSLEVDKLY